MTIEMSASNSASSGDGKWVRRTYFFVNPETKDRLMVIDEGIPYYPPIIGSHLVSTDSGEMISGIETIKSGSEEMHIAMCPYCVGIGKDPPGQSTSSLQKRPIGWIADTACNDSMVSLYGAIRDHYMRYHLYIDISASTPLVLKKT